jgi:hypothetical protein
MSNLFHRYQHLGTANEGFKTSLHERTGLIEDILARVVIDSLRRYQERLQVGIQDSVTDLLSSFKLQIAEDIYQASQNWMVATHREPILFPPSCRYLYTLAGSTLVVIEQEPIIRTLRLDKYLFENYRSPRAVAQELESSTNSFLIESKRLAIPYTVFILHFRNDALDGSGDEKFRNLYMGWRNSPLSSLNDQIYAPYLPNIHAQNYTVCTGNHGLASKGGISVMTQRVITDFWNSDFNTDLSTHWYNKDSIPQIATVDDWEKNSREDPLFILTVPLVSPISVNGLIKTICTAAEENAPETMDLRHRITEMTDTLSDQLFRGIKNYVFRTKFDRFYPKDVTDNLAGVMETVAKQLHTVALGIEIQLNDINEELNGLRTKDYKWRKRGPSWND